MLTGQRWGGSDAGAQGALEHDEGDLRAVLVEHAANVPPFCGGLPGAQPLDRNLARHPLRRGQGRTSAKGGGGGGPGSWSGRTGRSW